MQITIILLSLSFVGIVFSRGLTNRDAFGSKGNERSGNRLIRSCEFRDLHVPENGKRAVESTLVGSEAKFDCNVGFVLVGQAVSVCLPNGRWSARSPWCRPICEYTTCPSGTKCRFDAEAGVPTCECKTEYDCPLSKKLVCGSDDQTYASECVLSATACHRAVDNLEVKSIGECSSTGMTGLNSTCPMCPKIKICPALYKSTFAITGKVIMTTRRSSSQADLTMLVDEVHKGNAFFKPGKKAVIKVTLSQRHCSCKPTIPSGRVLIMGRSLLVSDNGVIEPLIDELSFVERYYSPKQLNLCWLY